MKNKLIWTSATVSLPSEYGEYKLRIDGKEAWHGEYKLDRYDEAVFVFEGSNGFGELNFENFHLVEWKK